MEKVVRIAFFFFFLTAFLILSRVIFLDSYPDFNQYFFGAKTVNPYLNGIIYPPFSILLFSLLTLVPFFWAEKIWTVLSLISLFVSICLIFKLYNKKIFSILGLLIISLVCLSFPVKFTLGMGQINNFILLLFVLAVYFLNKNKNYLLAFFLSLSLAIKFFPIFFPLYFLIIKKWKILFSFLLGFTVLNLIAFITNPKISIYFYKEIFPSLLGGWKIDYYNQSLTGFIGRGFGLGIISEVFSTCLSLVFVIVSFFAVFKSLKDKKLQNMCLGLLITLNLIVSNFSWQHHFVFMIFPFLITLFYVLNFKNNSKFLLIIFISYLLVSVNLKNPNDFPVILESHVFYGAVLLWIMQVFIILKNSPRLRLGFSLAWKH